MDFGGYIFNVKVDARRTPKLWDAMEEHNHVPFIKLEKTPNKRREAMVAITKQYYERFG